MKNVFRCLLGVAALTAMFFIGRPLIGFGEQPAAQGPVASLETRLADKGLKAGDAVFIRIFKNEFRLEIWMKPEKSAKYILFHEYPICFFSGDLGPKQKKGDYQAPEGFYAFGLRHLNPYSSYHLSFDLGYPNAYDRAQGYTGSLLMVHGDCVSAGCYAMTDARIEEIYGLVQAALENKQPFIRVHAFPFRLTRENMALYAGHQWHDFWLMLQPAYLYFENHAVPPEVTVEEGRYKLVE